MGDVVLFVGVVSAGAMLYCLVALFAVKFPYSCKWIKLIFDRKEQLMRQAPGRRIVIAGGSSSRFSVRAAQLERGTGVPTVNYGIVSGIQTPYLLARLKSVLRPGDFLFMPLEYSFYMYEGSVSQIFANYIRTFDVGYLLRLSPPMLWAIVKRTPPTQVFESIKDLYRMVVAGGNIQVSNPVYDVKYTNEYGDQIGNDGSEEFLTKFKSGYYSPMALPEDPSAISLGLRLICQFKTWCDENDIDLVCSFPAMVHFEAYETGEHRHYLEGLVKHLHECGIRTVGAPLDFFYEPEAFHDSRYHLNSEYSVLHTERILRLLRVPLSQAGLGEDHA